ncbi:MAG TPA: histidinol-phosphate transaminase [Gammaproteobacteria bacterium]|nr:histidinol-phosphate transaminase [Gammaproteobacteria bacterium]
MVDISFQSLAVEGVRGLQPYQAGKPLEELEREYGIHHAVKLASNENPLGPGKKALAAIEQQLSGLSRYPDGNGFCLKKALSKKHGVSMDQLTLGNGSNDILEFLARAFVASGDEVIFSKHAFAVYPIVTQAVGGRAVIVAAKNYGYDLDAIAAAVNDKTRLVFIANPNNPTGTWLTEKDLRDFLKKIPVQVLVVLDEAYYEYAMDPALRACGYTSVMGWLNEYPNLVVTRTFSKAYGLAGLRIGYSVSHVEVADILNRVRQPFNTNSLALAAAVAALADEAHLQRSIKVNAEGMQVFKQAFEQLGLEYIPSVGNFICVKVGDAAGVYEALLRAGIIVRPVANYGLPEYLRITVGRADENARFLDALKKILSA